MSRVQLEIALGTLFVFLTSILLIYIGVNEPKRMQEFEARQAAQAIEVGAELYSINCVRCHGDQGLGTPGFAPPLNDKHFFEGRLSEVGWSGTQEDYIISTVSGGRLVSTRPDQYPGEGHPAMPAWAERYGGPLRDDQIRSIAAFILNWRETAGEVSTPTLAGPPVGTDITKALPAGEDANGEALATSQGCVACHVTTTTGPAWAATVEQAGIGARAETRLTEPDYEGQAETPEQYLFESIVNPSAYLAEGFQDLMPKNFSATLTDQDVADLIAYMLTIR